MLPGVQRIRSIRSSASGFPPPFASDACARPRSLAPPPPSPTGSMTLKAGLRTRIPTRGPRAVNRPDKDLASMERRPITAVDLRDPYPVSVLGGERLRPGRGTPDPWSPYGEADATPRRHGSEACRGPREGSVPPRGSSVEPP